MHPRPRSLSSAPPSQPSPAPYTLPSSSSSLSTLFALKVNEIVACFQFSASPPASPPASPSSPPPPHLLTPPRRLHSWPSPPGKLLLSQRGTFTKREEEEEVSNKPQRSPLSQLDFTFLYIEQSRSPPSFPHRLTHLLPDLQPDPTPHPPILQFQVDSCWMTLTEE